MTPSQLRFAPSAEGSIAYDDLAPTTASHERVFLCAPSLGDTRAEYRAIAPELAQRGRVLSMDLPGHGKSDTTFTRYDADALADTMIATLDHAGVERAVLVGCSVSGGAAIVAAARAPERVEGLVLLAPFTRKARGEYALGLLMGALFAGPWAGSVWSSYYRSLYKRTRPEDLEAHIDSLRAMLRDPARRRALVATIRGSKGPVQARRASVKAPTEIVFGSKDPDFSSPSDEARILCEAIGAHAQSALLDGLGHYPHVEDPRAVLARIDVLLARLDERSSPVARSAS